jgi:hypothetical protein
MRRISLLKYLIPSLAVAALVLGGGGAAQAGFIQLFSPGDLNPGDTTAIYAGADGDVVPSPVMLSAGGNTLTFTTDTGGNFQRVDQGTSWTGAFPNGTKLLWTLDPVTNMGSSVTIGFTNPILEVGLQVQQDHAVDTTFTASVFSGATNELTIMVTVPDSGSGPGNLGFIGFRATGGDTITSISISSVDSSNPDPSFNSDFAMGPVTFGSPQTIVPEPSSLVLGGFSTLWLIAFRFLRRKTRAG